MPSRRGEHAQVAVAALGNAAEMLLTHGARAVLRAATVAKQAGRTIEPLRAWALAVQARFNHNKAACALANKLARICYATLRDGEPYAATRLTKKLQRTAYPLPA